MAPVLWRSVLSSLNLRFMQQRWLNGGTSSIRHGDARQTGSRNPITQNQLQLFAEEGGKALSL